jgi:tetratricopeptide (TPR) repeat protein
VEVTQVGKPFDQAWEQGAQTYRQAGERARVYDVSEAWIPYPPATLPEGTGVTPPSREDIKGKFPGVLSGLAALRFQTLSRAYREDFEKEPSHLDSALQLGLLYAEDRQWTPALEWFNKVLAQEPAHAAALNNRANVHLLMDEPAKAVPLYEKAVQVDPQDSGIWLNLSRAAWRAGDKAKARQSYDRALKESPALKDSVGPFDEYTKALGAPVAAPQ